MLFRAHTANDKKTWKDNINNIAYPRYLFVIPGCGDYLIKETERLTNLLKASPRSKPFCKSAKSMS